MWTISKVFTEFVTVLLMFYVLFFGLKSYGIWAFQVALEVKNPPASAGVARDVGSIPGLGRSPGVGSGKLLQYHCLENAMDRGAWWAAGLGGTKSQTWLSRSTRALFGILAPHPGTELTLSALEGEVLAIELRGRPQWCLVYRHLVLATWLQRLPLIGLQSGSSEPSFLTWSNVALSSTIFAKSLPLPHHQIFYQITYIWCLYPWSVLHTNPVRSV